MKRLVILMCVLFSFVILKCDYQDELKEMKNKFKEQGYSESEQLFYLGGYQYTEGYFEDAIISFMKSKELGLPENYNTTVELFISLTYMELREYKKALEHINIGMNYDHDYAYESIRLIIKHKLSEDIEIEKKDLIDKWVMENEIEQYLLCDFLLKVEDYENALLAIIDYEIMLKEKDITTTNLQYIFYTHAYYELGVYEKAMINIEKAKQIELNENSKSYIYYWEALTNYKLGNEKEACESLQTGKEIGWDYHGRFMLLQFWRFSDENIKLLEEIEKNCTG